MPVTVGQRRLKQRPLYKSAPLGALLFLFFIIVKSFTTSISIHFNLIVKFITQVTDSEVTVNLL